MSGRVNEAERSREDVPDGRSHRGEGSCTNNVTTMRRWREKAYVTHLEGAGRVWRWVKKLSLHV